MRRWSMWLMVVGAVSTAQAQETDGRVILERVIEVYGSAEDYRAETLLSMVRPQRVLIMPGRLAFRRPNWVRQHIGPPSRWSHQVVIANPTHRFHSFPNLGQYTKKTPPERVLDDGLAMGMFTVEDLLAGADVWSVVDEVVLERRAHYYGKPVYVLRVESTKGPIQWFWVGEDDYLVHKMAWTMGKGDAERLVHEAVDEMSRADELEGAAKAREEKAAEDIHRWVGAGYSVMDPATDFAWTIRYKNVAINSGLPDSLFRYDPRPGEARVDEIDMSEGWAQVARE